MRRTITITLPQLHQAQYRIQREAKRFNVLACGRRFGKTALGIQRASEPAMAGKPVGWFAPNFKYLTEAWRDFVRYLGPVITRKSETERRIELVGGGSIEFWSLEDPDSGRSRKYKRVCIDEAAKARHLERAWNGAIRATLADYRGDADFYSTPRGHDFFWKSFVKGQDENEPEWACWRFPTLSNPFIHPDEVEAARKQLPERYFKQEYLAEFLDDAGGVFRKVREAVDLGRVETTAPIPRHRYCTGIDLARVEDFTVITVLDSKGVQVYHERFNQISWERQIAAIKAAIAKYPGEAFLDSTGVGDPIFEQLQKAGVKVSPYQFTNASKNALIDNLAIGLEGGKLRLMDVPVQEAELTAFEYQLTQARNVRMSAPEGIHDDCVISLALAYWAFINPRSMRFY
jgi:hypothetical protein